MLTGILPALVALVAGVAAYDAVFRRGIDYFAIQGDDVARREAVRDALRYVPATVAGVALLSWAGMLTETLRLVILGLSGMAAWDAYKQATEVVGSSVNAVTKERAVRRFQTDLPVALFGFLLLTGAGVWAFAPFAYTGLVVGRRLYQRRRAKGRFL
jgi:hypothetical protein